jgi:hypothetical protein
MRDDDYETEPSLPNINILKESTNEYNDTYEDGQVQQVS